MNVPAVGAIVAVVAIMPTMVIGPVVAIARIAVSAVIAVVGAVVVVAVAMNAADDDRRSDTCAGPTPSVSSFRPLRWGCNEEQR
jgi:hypothetical protein